VSDHDDATVPAQGSTVTEELELAPPALSPVEASRRAFAEELVERARADGVDLVGPDGLLADVTKLVLEAGLEVEMDEHLGYTKHAVEGRNRGNSRNGTRSKTVLTNAGLSRSTCPATGTAPSSPRRSRSVSGAWSPSTRW
jgi:hypothetical protein